MAAVGVTVNRQNRQEPEEEWHPVRGRVIAGILCEVSRDGRRLRFKKGRRIEVVQVDGLTIIQSGVLTEPETGLQ